MKLKLFFLMLFLSMDLFVYAQTPFFNEYITEFTQTCETNNDQPCGAMISPFNSRTVLVSGDGHYNLTIKEVANGSQSPILMKVDFNGDEVFTKTVTPSGLVAPTPQGQPVYKSEIADMVYNDGFLYVVLSRTWLEDGASRESILAKIDLTGEEVWSTRFGSFDPNDPNFIVNDIEVAKDTIYYVGTKFIGAPSNGNSFLMFGKLTKDGIPTQNFAYREAESNLGLRGLTLTPNKAQSPAFDFYIGASYETEDNTVGLEDHRVIVIGMNKSGTVHFSGSRHLGIPNLGFNQYNTSMALPIINNNDSKFGDPVLFFRDNGNIDSYTALRLNQTPLSIPMNGIEVTSTPPINEYASFLVDAEVTQNGRITSVLNENHTTDFPYDDGKTFLFKASLNSPVATAIELLDNDSRVNGIYKRKGNGYMIEGILQRYNERPNNFLLAYEEGNICREEEMISALQRQITFTNLPIQLNGFSEFRISNVPTLSAISTELNTIESDLCPLDTIPCFVSTPTGLWCEQSQGGTELNWSSVSGASTYTLSFYTNDGDCCCDGQSGPFPMTIENIETNSFFFEGTAECYSWTVTAFCPDDVSDESEKVCFNIDQQDCFAPGDLDCKEECLPPTNLTCEEVTTGIQLDWDDVSDATGYIVNISPNDEDCCCKSELLPIPISVTVSTSEYLFPVCLECFSWTVTAICADGSTTEPSEKMCYSEEEAGCFEPGTLDCEEECCTDAIDIGCISIKITEDCQSAFFSLDPDCLPMGKNCVVHHIDWTTKLNGVPDGVFPNNGMTATWVVDITEIDLPTPLIGCAELILDNGDTCKIQDQIMVGGDSYPCPFFVDDNEGGERNSSGETESKVMDLIHPNPVLKGSAIQLSHLNLLDARNLEVINMNGIVLLEKDANRSELIIPEEFVSGVYYLKVTADNESRIYKFLVQ